MTVQVGEIMKQAELLSSSDQLELAVLLIERARQNPSLATQRHRWMDAAGVAPYPLTGEDAQDWISRTRQEGDDEREQQWRP
jgi:hypothetical protein